MRAHSSQHAKYIVEGANYLFRQFFIPGSRSCWAVLCETPRR